MASEDEVGIPVGQGIAKLTTRELKENLDSRNELAASRTLLAAERTYAAWVRTALAALVTGVGSRALLEDAVAQWLASLTGSLLVLFAGFCLVAAIWPGLDDQVPPVGPDRKRMPQRVLIGVNCVLLVLTLGVLVGLWAA